MKWLKWCSFLLNAHMAYICFNYRPGILKKIEKKETAQYEN